MSRWRRQRQRRRSLQPVERARSGPQSRLERLGEIGETGRRARDGGTGSVGWASGGVRFCGGMVGLPGFGEFGWVVEEFVLLKCVRAIVRPCGVLEAGDSGG